MFRYALLIGFFIATSGVKAGPIISEFLASNQSSLKDEDGESGDWIEIHNPENLEADLTGYSLSDDPETPKKWTFPAGTSLRAFFLRKKQIGPQPTSHQFFNRDFRRIFAAV
ncbi:lamin tail domain-containing protein [Akkermansiaceae bacterium]|nr:lamin tail domain-containing protein [Akkermansiaceae bacterium]